MMPLIVTAFRILSVMPNIGHVQTVRKLYKTIFRLHRGLPLEMQALGDSYLREEFKRHKAVEDRQQRDVFLGEWTVGTSKYGFMHFERNNEERNRY